MEFEKVHSFDIFFDKKIATLTMTAKKAVTVDRFSQSRREKTNNRIVKIRVHFILSNEHSMKREKGDVKNARK